MKIPPVKEPFVRSPYNYNVDAASDESGLRCEDASLTQQHQKDQADINFIIDQFNVTGILPVSPVSPQYGDFSGIGDYHSAMNAVMNMHDEFMTLPPAIRSRFDNDPEELFDFLSNEDNREEAIKLGLIQPVQAAVIDVSNEDKTPLEGAADAA
jgi:phage internal scaffolding protein